MGKNESGHTGTRQGSKLGKYLTTDLEVHMKDLEEIVGTDSECIPVKEVVENISAEAVGQIEQEQGYIYNL